MMIGILECGAAPSDLVARHGTYDSMMRRMLGPHRAAVTYDVVGGALPANVAECEAYVVTGSSSGVYDGDAWIDGLIGFLRTARGRARLVGICFGHQAMAVAFGGQVVKSPKGWGIGLQRYDVTAPAAWMDPVPHVDVPASHQDQVVVQPPQARVVAANAFTPQAGLDYGDAISFQFHPEFSRAFAVGLIETRQARYGALAGPALASHAGPDDCARVGQWIGRFLDRPAAPG